MIILIFLYLLLIYYCIILVSKIPPKETFSWHHIREFTETRTQCKDDGDCLSDEKCYRDACVKTLTRECNPNTGMWVLTDSILKCVCKYPHLITQTNEGTNCNVDVACGLHGSLNNVIDDPMTMGECECEDGYMAVRDNNMPNCVKKMDLDELDCYPFDLGTNTCDCPENYISSDSNDAKRIFDPKYLSQFGNKKKCLRRPCTFDVLNGNKELLHGELVDDRFCKCDARYGLFGVKLNVQNYLKTDSYNACASIFEDGESIEPNVDVILYCYYYIDGKLPMCFIQFRKLKNVSPVFGNAKEIIISEPWSETNFFQVILETASTTTHTRKCFESIGFYCDENIWVDNLRINCDGMNLDKMFYLYYKVGFYNKVYMYPFCKYTRDNDMPEYKGKYILNPLMIELKDYPKLLRSDGIEIRPLNNNRWSVDYAGNHFWTNRHLSYPKIKHTYTYTADENNYITYFYK